jgi:hypothetical protein
VNLLRDFSDFFAAVSRSAIGWATADCPVPQRPVPARIVAGLQLIARFLGGPFRPASSPGYS